jgi:hypothetical protein
MLAVVSFRLILSAHTFTLATILADYLLTEPDKPDYSLQII